MNFDLTEEQQFIRKTAREFAVNELVEGAVERDQNKIWPQEQINMLSGMGFMGMMVDPAWGGGGLDTISYSIVMEEIARADASCSVVVSVNNSLVCYLLEKYGSNHIKEKYLKDLAIG